MSDHSEARAGRAPGPPFPRYVPAPALSWTDTGADLVLYDRIRGSYHALNASASAIWRQLGESGAEAEIAAALVARFPGNGDAVAGDVSAFLARALAEGLIEPV